MLTRAATVVSVHTRSQPGVRRSQYLSDAYKKNAARAAVTYPQRRRLGRRTEGPKDREGYISQYGEWAIASRGASRG
jgi:hypothetical protein